MCYTALQEYQSLFHANVSVLQAREGYLTEKKIAFTDIDVARTRRPRMMVKLGPDGSSVIDVDGQVIVGWNKGALEEALGMKQKA